MILLESLRRASEELRSAVRTGKYDGTTSGAMLRVWQDLAFARSEADRLIAEGARLSEENRQLTAMVRELERANRLLGASHDPYAEDLDDVG